MTESISDLRGYLESFVQRRPSLWTLTACGVTRSGREILALVDHDAYLPSSRRARILLISGLSGRSPDVEQAMVALDMFASTGQRFAAEISLSAVPCGNPDGLALGLTRDNGAGGDPSTTTDPVSAYIEIVEVLALPPLGDGDARSGNAATATMLLAALAALGLVAGGRRLTGLASTQR